MASIAYVAHCGANSHDPGMNFHAAVELRNRHTDPAEISVWKHAKLPSGDQGRRLSEIQIAMHRRHMEHRIGPETGPIRSPERLVSLKVHVQLMLGVIKEERGAAPIENLDASTQRCSAILGLIRQVAGPRLAMAPTRHYRDAPAIRFTLGSPLPVEAPQAHYERRNRDACLKPFGYIGRCHEAMVSRVGVLAEATR